MISTIRNDFLWFKITKILKICLKKSHPRSLLFKPKLFQLYPWFLHFLLWRIDVRKQYDVIFGLPSTSAENPVGNSLSWCPSSKTVIRTSFLAKMTWGRLPPWKKTFGYVIINLACFFPKTVCNTDKFGTLIDIIE